MARSGDSIAHSDLSRSDLKVRDVADAGDGSRIFHEDAVDEMASEHDGRSKRVLVNRGLIPAAGDLLVDIVTYRPGVSCPVHYHEGTDHFFYILSGEGVLEIEGVEYEIKAGTVAWIGEGDKHRLFAREGQKMEVLEYFSHGEHDTTFFGEECTWRPDGT